MNRLLRLLPLLSLAACCSYDNQGDCTPEEREKVVERHLTETTPELVLEKDGVRLYRIWTIEPNAHNHWTHFTTPCGATSALIDYSCGKNCHNQVRSDVNGVGC